MTEEQKAFEAEYKRVNGNFGLNRNQYYPDEYDNKLTREEYDRWRMTVAAVRYAIQQEASKA